MHKYIILSVFLLLLALPFPSTAQDDSASSNHTSITLRAENLELTIHRAFLVNQLDDVDSGTLLVLDGEFANNRTRFEHCFAYDQFHFSQQDEEVKHTAWNGQVRDQLFPDREYPGNNERHCVAAGDTEATVISFEIDPTINVFTLAFTPTAEVSTTFDFDGPLDDLYLTVLQTETGIVTTSERTVKLISLDSRYIPETIPSSTSDTTQNYAELTTFEQQAYSISSSGIYAVGEVSYTQNEDTSITVIARVDVLPSANDVITAEFLATAAQITAAIEGLAPISHYNHIYILWDREGVPIQYTRLVSTENGRWETEELPNQELTPLERPAFLDPAEPAQFAIINQDNTPIRAGASTDPEEPFISEIIFNASTNDEFRIERTNTYEDGDWHIIWFFDEELDFYRSGHVQASDTTVRIESASYDENNLVYNPIDARTLYVTSNTVNLRAGPTTDAEIVGSTQRGDALTAIGVNNNLTWYYVELTDGTFAWIFASLTSTTAPSASSNSGRTSSSQSAATAPHTPSASAVVAK